MNASPLSVLLAAATGLSVMAQAPTPSPFALPANVGSCCGLQQESDGTLLAVGADYKAAFADGRIVFTPMLGRAAPRDLPLSMQVTHAGRGELAAVGTAVTEHGELRVDHVRPQLRERFDVRPEGCKQSFVFDQLPPGAGDLVVRTRLASELRPERAASDGALRFLFPGAGGVEIGQVVGIDALGHHTTGSLRCHGDTLDFVLPAEFVARAALPLVVDPLIGAIVFVPATNDDERAVDVAHIGAPFNQYMVVWRQTVSAGNNDIRALRFVDDLSNTFGGLLSLESSASNATTPRAIDVTPSACWLVLWEQAGDIVGLKITNSTVSAVVTIAGGATVQTAPDLAGSLLGGQPIAIPVWLDVTTNTVAGAVVNMQGAVPTVGVTTTLASAAVATELLFAPAVSRANPIGEFLLTHVVRDSTTLLQTVRAGAFSTTLVPLCAEFVVAGSPGVVAADPAVAGDGRTWVAAYETTATGQGQELWCRNLRVNSGLIELGTPRLLTPAGEVRSNPTVAWFGESALIGCTRVNGTQHDVLVTAIDPFTCADCEGTLVVDLGGNAPEVALTSRFKHQPASSEGLIAYVPIGVSSGGNIQLQRFGAIDGVTSNGSGSCAQGIVHASCARVGNAAFQVRLRHGLANQFGLIVLSTGQINFPCGPCTVVPDFTIGIVGSVGVTSPLGDAGYPLAIPNNPLLANQSLFAQFAFFGASCLGTFVLTQGVQFTIE